MLEPGRKPRATGPNLVGAVGQPVMHDAKFEFYSLAMKAAQAKGLTWTDENLMAYMADPKGFLNEFNGEELRSSMTFQLKEEAKRRGCGRGSENHLCLPVKVPADNQLGAIGLFWVKSRSQTIPTRNPLCVCMRAYVKFQGSIYSPARVWKDQPDPPRNS